ncbi:hypothetical protein VNI00_014139 [Paramarasmius palmivorus]|uniref:Plasma-membrane choline transporter-domain-containing protein n=1 Tax=Paramarasmius palmivorus TaxID=297713 RepID=A0AAW0BU14_9AGAR
MSFATYASQFINRQQAPEPSSSMSGSGGMFFSFTTEGSSEEEDERTDRGRRGGGAMTASRGFGRGSMFGSFFGPGGERGRDNGRGRGKGRARDRDRVDFNELDGDDPHLLGLEELEDVEDDDQHTIRNVPDDPYLRLDDEEAPLHPHHSRSRSPSPQGGWLAHQAQGLSSPSSSSSSSDDLPPHDLLTQPSPPIPRTSRQAVSLSLTESLLPRDGQTRPVDIINLPDPRFTRRHKYQDSIWTALWLFGVTVCLIACIVLLFTTSVPSSSKGLPYTTLLHTVPLLVILTATSAVVAYAYILTLWIWLKPVLIVSSVAVPLLLVVSFVWAFVGSFMWDSEDPTWGETVGLRLFSLIPLALAIWTGRRLIHLPQQIHSASAQLALVIRLLAANPYLLALSPAILLATLLASIPFLTLIFRLLLVGYYDKSKEHWHLKTSAHYYLAGAIAVWLWTFAVARGILRVVVSGVVGGWYIEDPPQPLPALPSLTTLTTLHSRAPDTRTFHAALTRASGPSLGTICLSALILTLVRLLALVALFLDRLPSWIDAGIAFLRRAVLGPVFGMGVGAIGRTAATTVARGTFMGLLITFCRWGVRYLESVTETLSGDALVYTGLTGEGFWVSARRGAALLQQHQGHRNRVKKTLPIPIHLFTLTLALPYALGTYIFVSHTLDAPAEAFGAAVLAGGVTSLTAGFVVGLVGDMADAVWLCFVGFGEKREEIREVFEREGLGRRRRPAQGPQQPQPSQQQRPPPAPAPVRSQPLSREELDDDGAPPEDILFDAAGQVEAGAGPGLRKSDIRSPSPSPPPKTRLRSLSSSSSESEPLVPPVSFMQGSSSQAHENDDEDMGPNPFLTGGDVDPFVGGDPEVEESVVRTHSRNTSSGGSMRGSMRGSGSRSLKGSGSKSKRAEVDEEEQELFPGSGIF